MKMRPGYKRTEVGVIPEDWDVQPLSEGVKLLSGHHVLAKHCNTDGDGNPYITGPADFPNGVIQHTKYTTSPTTICRANDILVTVKGSGAGTLVLSDAEYCISRQLMAIRVNDWSTSYIYFSLLQNASLFGAAATGLIPGLSRSDILNKALPLPPTLAEQRAIAAALSDVDALISALDKLIAKKRDIKQATMQQLLTGKKRLPGFSGEWEVEKVKQFGEIVTGGTPPTTVKEFWNGNIPWVTPTDISEAKDIYSSEREITSLGLESIRGLPSNSVLVTCIASIGKNAVLRAEGACNQQINAIVPNKEHDADFLYYLIDSSKQYLLGNASITATSIISKRDFSELQFSVPSKDEQQAIAAILSDMDVEIAALERKRDKTRALRQGMMQELLTGRIRLT